MAIEQALAENTAATTDLAATVASLLTFLMDHHLVAGAEAYAKVKAITAEPDMTAAEAATATAAVVAEAKAKAPAAIKPIKPAPAPAADIGADLPDTDTPAGTVAYDVVASTVRKMIAGGYRDAVVDALKQFGCAKASDLRAEQYGEFMAAIKTLVL